MKNFLSLALLACLTIATSSFAQSVAIMKGIYREGSASQGELDNHSNRIKARLETLGVKATLVPDLNIKPDSLKSIKIAIFPYNAPLLENDAKTIGDFVANGGKLLVFYTNDEYLAKLLDIEKPKYYPRAQFGSPAAVKFNALLQGLPQTMAQNSWNILHPVPLPNSPAKVLARWIDKDGKELGYNAATISKNGVVFAHTYLDQDPMQGAKFLFAIVAGADPDAWPNAAKSAIDNAGVFVGENSFHDLKKRIDNAYDDDARKLAYQADKLLQNAKLAQSNKKYPEAVDLAQQADVAIKNAYAKTIPPRRGELRGAWIHSAYGISDWGWDKTIKTLAENGFNAVFPNMLWGYVADYESDVLPRHPAVKTKGDQIKLCLEACEKYGLEMHVWKVCWNMGYHTPPELIKKMQDANKTQLKLDGSQTRYLAPHIPENLQLEIEAMLEIVRKYKVHGIHFDYIRYPDSSTDFSGSAKLDFEKFLGKQVENWPKDCAPNGKYRTKYNEWRRNNITQLVKNVYPKAKKIRSDIQVSAAVFINWESAKNSIAQDPVDWLDNNCLDFICPMNYTADDHQMLQRITLNQLKATQNRVPLYAGLGSYQHADPASTAHQIDIVRKAGADGFICFQHDSRFATQFLPNLKDNATSSNPGTLLPHHSPYATFTFKAKKEYEFKDIFKVNEAVNVTAAFPKNTRFRKPLQVNILKNGYHVQNQPNIKISRSRTNVNCEFSTREPGDYRIEITDNETILTRSQTIRILDDEAFKDRVAREGPPLFRYDGKVRVAVWQDNAYGATYILNELLNDNVFDAAPLHNLKPTSLKPCQVIILPQPRQNSTLFKSEETAKILQDYINKGGAIITTHAMVGTRGFVNIAPLVVATVDDKPAQISIWKTNRRHEIARNLPTGDIQSTFVDMITMKPGRAGTAVATTSSGLPAIVAGKVGRGRYIACGLGLGIGRNDKDAKLSEEDIQLLHNMVYWSAGLRLR
ncbi:MAG: family 10 glycosylhydrolase [Lentisphaerae bacterium]|jgi:uncharacterized lipoprotein YddW (UPF0748 family)|nr:family 10 glycosylhydrolase [Lentisphaerota bacterium]